MGAPELPNEPGEELRNVHVVHPPAAASDDSDNESVLDGVDYEGYQPLAMDDSFGHSHDYDRDNPVSNNMEHTSTIQTERGLDELEEVVHGDPNIPKIETVDAEIEHEVWSQPRPRELQIELDGNKTQQILKAMANVQLPNLAVPDWAAGVPEECWKNELLQRIRQSRHLNNSNKMEVDEESK